MIPVQSCTESAAEELDADGPAVVLDVLDGAD